MTNFRRISAMVSVDVDVGGDEGKCLGAIRGREEKTKGRKLRRLRSFGGGRVPGGDYARGNERRKRTMGRDGESGSSGRKTGSLLMSDGWRCNLGWVGCLLMVRE